MSGKEAETDEAERLAIARALEGNECIELVVRECVVKALWLVEE